MKRIVATLVIAASMIITASAQADPAVGDGCTTANNETGVVVTSLSSYDGFGCDVGTHVDTTTWWSDHRDENGCNAWGDLPRGYCI